MKSFRGIWKSKLLLNIRIVATGLLTAQVISIAFTPFLTRIYSPENFGVLASFVAVLTILNPATTLGYSTAVVLPGDRNGAIEVARLSTFCAFLLVPTSIIGIWVFEEDIAQLTNLQDHAGILYLLPVAAILTAMLSIADQMAIRASLFRPRAVAKILSSLVNNFGKLIFGILAPTGEILIAMTILSIGTNYTFLITLSRNAKGFDIREWVKLEGILTAAKKYRDFPFYRLPQSIINASALGMPVILLTSFFGPEMAGQYSLTSLVLGAPALLLGKSVLDVFYPKITREIEQDKDRARVLLRNSTAISLAVALAIFVPIAIISPEAFPLVFGDEWIYAGEFAQWVSIWMIGVVVSRPYVASYPALKLQKHLLALEVFGGTTRIVSICAGAAVWNSALMCVALFSITSLFNLIIISAIASAKIGGKVDSGEKT